MKRFGTFVLLVLIALLLSGCPVLDDKAISVAGVGWLIQNIDQTFWDTPPPAHAFFSFSIVYTGSDIIGSDISSVRVTAPDSTVWLLESSSCTVDTQNKRIELPALYKSGSIDVLPIGTFTFLVTLTNGSTATLDLLVPAPNATTTGGYTSVHTEDVSSPPTGSALLVRRAVLGTHRLDTTTLSIEFSVADSKVYNGYVWFYDAADTYIGYSTTRFRDADTGNVVGIVNGGAGVLYTEGTTNTVVFGSGDITYLSGKSFSDVDRFVLVLTDGAQYTPQHYTACDCRSFSAKTSF